MPTQEPPQANPERLAPRGHSLALPHDEDAPAEAAQRALHAAIAGGVAVDLGEPVRAVGGGNAAAAAGVAMPETARDEDGLVEAVKDEVGHAGKRGDMNARPETERAD